MDTLYIGDIPSEYHYAKFYSDYIDLYNAPVTTGQTTYYRIYTSYDNYFNYVQLTSNFTYNNTAYNISVSNDYIYRRDFPSIMFMSVVYIAVIVLLLNLVTSVFKKGGVLSGLL